MGISLFVIVFSSMFLEVLSRTNMGRVKSTRIKNILVSIEEQVVRICLFAIPFVSLCGISLLLSHSVRCFLLLIFLYLFRFC